MLLPSIPLCIKDALALGDIQSVIVHSLKGPLANEDRELGLLPEVRGLAADRRGDVLGVRTSSGEEVDMGVDNQVRVGIEQGRPIRSSLEAILQHDGNALVDSNDPRQDALHILHDPGGSLLRETISGTKSSQIVTGLVDGSDSECIHMTTAFDEFENLINSLPAVI